MDRSQALQRDVGEIMEHSEAEAMSAEEYIRAREKEVGISKVSAFDRAATEIEKGIVPDGQAMGLGKFVRGEQEPFKGIKSMEDGE